MAYTILILENNELNMKLFNDVLQTNGYDTIQCIDSQKIVQLASKNKPDLVIIDVKFLEIFNLDLIKKLKSENVLKRVPFIAVTAHAMEGDETKLIEEGYDGYIAKPISVTKFLVSVSEFLK